MSAEAIRAVSSLTLPITVSERILLTTLAQDADPHGLVVSDRASQCCLAKQCGWAKADYVRQVSKRLVGRGLLEIVCAGRRGAPATYRLPFVRGPAP